MAGGRVPGADELDTLDAGAVRRWSAAALAGLETGRDDIDALNVFPVPDGDTGTNMLATLRAAHRALEALNTREAAEASGGDAAAAVRALAQGAALGAIGNSGFILSQILRGLAETEVGGDGWGASALCAGLDAGARLGRAAVVTPVDGTILTVARAAADAADDRLTSDRLTSDRASLAEVASAALQAAREALDRTPSQLPDLAEAGVVDAGGRGLLVLLDALARTIAGPSAVPPLEPGQAPAEAHLFAVPRPA